MLPTDFLYQIQEKLPKEEVLAFQKAFDEPVPTSIRINPFKKIKFEDALEPTNWCTNGFYLPKRPVFTLDPAFHAGAYYVQEASSMFVAHILQQTLDLTQPLKVLDLCAAPGGKSTLALNQLSTDSLLVSNEVIKSRYRILQENLYKWGRSNIAMSNHDPKELAGLSDFFDILLIDAPCSGEGLFRKDTNAANEWSLDHVAFCCNRQKRILNDVLPLLKAGGLLLYSTCTYNASENMQNVAWLTQNFPLKTITVALPDAGIVEEKIDENVGYQFYPHKIKGEGFFISALKKEGITTTSIKSSKKSKNLFQNLTKVSNKQVAVLEKWIAQSHLYAFYQTPNHSILAFPKSLLPSYLKLDTVLKRKHFGIPIGSFKQTDFIPSHELALSTLIHLDVPAIEVDKKTALQFLKKENINGISNQKGWQLVRYQGLNLGWIKVLSGRINNYLPKSYRIRMEIS